MLLVVVDLLVVCSLVFCVFVSCGLLAVVKRGSETWNREGRRGCIIRTLNTFSSL